MAKKRRIGARATITEQLTQWSDVVTRATALRQERDELAGELRRVIGEAQTMLDSLGSARGARRRAQRPSTKSAGVPTQPSSRRRVISPAARARMAAAARRRWARHRAEKGAA